MKELQTISERLLHLCFIVILSWHRVLGTIDVNVNELEYLAARLNPFECRRLIAALHYTTYELPNSLAAAERNVDDDVPCLRHLLHWNGSPGEGKGNTHEALAHRLRQINRNDLADWLGKSAFSQLGKDLDRAVVNAFDGLGKEETEVPFPITLEPIHYEEEDPWMQIDIILLAVLLGLLGTLLTLICTMIVYKIKEHCREEKYKRLSEKKAKDEKERMEKSKKEIESNTESVSMDSETDTDFN